MATERRRIFGVAGAALLVVSIRAQLLPPKEPMPSFEVASIKLWSPGIVSSGAAPRVKVAPTGAAPAVGERVHFIGQIELLIESAYGLPFSSGNRIVGGPEWMRSESERYEVLAKIDEARYAAMQKMSAAQQQEQVSLMEQSLLADRLRFRAHIENREMPGYALVVAKGGSKLERSKGDEKSQLSFVREGQQGELRATAVSLEELVRSPFLKMDDRLMVDRTGLQGAFNFTLKFSVRPDADAGDDRDAPALPAALQAQLGLKLVAENVPAQVVVIDHIERPSGN